MSDFEAPPLQDPAAPPAGRGAKARRAARPVQTRSMERMARALEVAERLVAEVGPERTSIPEIERLSQVPRASIYQYFPDKYAIFSRLLHDHKQRLMAIILAAHPPGRHTDWRAMTRAVIHDTAAYYNANKAASILLLKGPFGANDCAATIDKDASLAAWFRALARDAGLTDPPEKPDAIALAMEMAFACLKYGYSHEGHASEALCDQATLAVNNYLATWE